VRKMPAFETTVMVLLLACVLPVSSSGSPETWADLSKRMNEKCVKFDTSIRDMMLMMEMSNPSSDGAFATRSVLYQKGKQFRAEISLEEMEGGSAGTDDMKTIVIDDGTNVWIVDPEMGKSQIPASEGGKYRGQWYCGDYIPASAAIIGSETIGTRNCYVLAVDDEQSDCAKLWIDRESFDLMKLEGKPVEGETTVVLFSDLRKVADGIELPYKTEIFSGTDLISVVVITSVEVNQGLADELFDPDQVKMNQSGDQDMLEHPKRALDGLRRNKEE